MDNELGLTEMATDNESGPVLPMVIVLCPHRPQQKGMMWVVCSYYWQQLVEAAVVAGAEVADSGLMRQAGAVVCRRQSLLLPQLSEWQYSRGKIAARLCKHLRLGGRRGVDLCLGC